MRSTDSKYHNYFAYGLVIKSDIELPDFVATDLPCSVVLRRGSVRNTPLYLNFKKSLEKYLANEENFQDCWAIMGGSKDGFCIEWKNIGCCTIKTGSEVVVELDTGARGEDALPFITTQVLAVLLHQRGNFVLHASSVLINGVAVVFLGNKGYGKSTVAAHLQVRGHKLVSDDLVPVNFRDGEIQTSFGFPKLKLFPDSISSIGLNHNEMPVVQRTFDKRFYRCQSGFSFEPVKIGCIFVLKEDRQIRVEKINPVQGFFELTRNTYLSNFIKATENTVEHFNYCRQVIETVPVYELKRPHDFDCVPRVTALVEEQISKITDLTYVSL